MKYCQKSNYVDLFKLRCQQISIVEKTHDFAYALKMFIPYSTVRFNYSAIEIVANKHMLLILQFLNVFLRINEGSREKLKRIDRN